jgi:type VI secretion system secreted protein Hcp
VIDKSGGCCPLDAFVQLWLDLQGLAKVSRAGVVGAAMLRLGPQRPEGIASMERMVGMRKGTTFAVALVAGLLTCGWAATASADDIYVSIHGQRQGRFPGDVTVKQHAGKIRATGYSAGVVSPRDVATGQATGKRQHKPMSFTKALGTASPQIFNALITNENLTSVVIEFVRAGKTGASETYYTVKLTNASITQTSQDAKPTEGAKAEGDASTSESVALTYQKIEISSKDGTAVDDILGGAQ